MHVGQKVECIKAHDARLYFGCIIPTVGQFYHIRDVDPLGEAGLHLVEIINAEVFCVSSDTGQRVFTEPSWFPENFRPVTDISALKALEKVKEPELELEEAA